MAANTNERQSRLRPYGTSIDVNKDEDTGLYRFELWKKHRSGTRAITWIIRECTSTCPVDEHVTFEEAKRQSKSFSPSADDKGQKFHLNGVPHNGENNSVTTIKYEDGSSSTTYMNRPVDTLKLRLGAFIDVAKRKLALATRGLFSSSERTTSSPRPAANRPQTNIPEPKPKAATTAQEEADGLIVKMAVAVAMSDGSLAPKEGEVIKAWIKNAMSSLSGERRERLKDVCNKALRAAYSEARSGQLSLNELAEQMASLGDCKKPAEAITLCFDVMAADGAADNYEMDALRRLSEALELDCDEITKIRDQRLIGLDLSDQQRTSVENLLSIPLDASSGEVKEYLRVEFAKWNSRLVILPEGPERNNAQAMLDAIGEARKKYM